MFREVARQFVDHLPHTRELNDLDVVSIKIQEPQTVDRASVSMRTTNTFQPIRFLIRNERRQKSVVLHADLKPKDGLVVSTATLEPQEIMRVTLPKETAEVVGKIQHPTSATLYKIHTTDEPGVLRVVKQDEKHAVTAVCERSQLRLLGCLKFFETVYDTNQTVLYLPGAGDTPIASVRPKYCLFNKSTATRVGFEPGAGGEHRAIALAVALLEQLCLAQPKLAEMLENTVTPTGKGKYGAVG